MWCQYVYLELRPLDVVITYLVVISGAFLCSNLLDEVVVNGVYWDLQKMEDSRCKNKR